MTSVAEAGLGALYIMALEAIYTRIILNEMGHKQPRNPVQTENSTAEGVINNKMQPKLTKAMDMHLSWLRCRLAQSQFLLHWCPGPINYEDYWTKHNPTAHHKHLVSYFLKTKKVLNEFRALQKKAYKGFLTCQTNRAFARVCISHVTQY